MKDLEEQTPVEQILVTANPTHAIIIIGKQAPPVTPVKNPPIAKRIKKNINVL